MTWAVTVAAEHGGSLGPLRLEPIEALLADRWWLRGGDLGGAAAARLASLPAAARFDLRGGGQLFRPGGRVPIATLPQGHWRPLRELLPVTAPATRLAGALPDGVPLRLVADDGPPRPEGALLTAWGTLAAWAEQAVAPRLSGLRFAVSADGDAVIVGLPVPPLPGERLTVAGRVLLPAGMTWRPAVEPRLLNLAMGVAGWTLWRRNGRRETLPDAAFAALDRSAVRRTGPVPQG